MWQVINNGVPVPGQISLVGYDDSRIASLSYVDLTSVRQDAATMADLALTAVLERLDGGRVDAREFVLEPILFVRDPPRHPTRAPIPASYRT